MSVPHRTVLRTTLVLACVALLGAAGSAAAAGPADSVDAANASPALAAQNILHRLCARQFEVAQRVDMESFRDYDAETFRAGHDERAVTVFDSGAVRTGIDAVMTALASHFRDREAKWSWTERYRVVDGCRSAYILYETVYEIPRVGYRQRALTGVTYTHDGFKWLAVADQGTKLP
ncbi:hypothetical protein GLE_2025 [Lysobacter enzymogenes]|uniref:SnoaL-like domain-containing protein n=1 Tax=Lysobacter enzymogenes TaxID=69 RepID=A0A0S2DGI4_LYSEN|nr:hypothetical protein [Lysobacter enzymogenes]ALN57375.1 hypothetical protein GLE_2025 [Lysobacter enzymogenes]